MRRLTYLLRIVLRRPVWRLRGWVDLKTLERSGLELGQNTFVGYGAHLDPEFCFLITIGDNAVLSLNVTILAHDASSRHIVDYGRVAPVRIGANAFLGAGTIVLPGVTVGDGAIVGAGSVVRHDVPPGSIVAGNPAKVIGSRSVYAAEHAGRMRTRPQWPREGWTVSTGITPTRRASMRAALNEHSEGYIK